MKHLDAILEMSDAEFGAIAQNGRFKSREEIDSVYKLIDIVKDIYCIWDMEEDGYSEGSYARRGRKRDSMGRYSRSPYRTYSNGNEEYIDQLHELMQHAPDEGTRQSIQRMIQQMQG